MPIQAAFTSKAVTRIFQRDIASLRMSIILIAVTSANTTANKDYLYTKNRSQNKKKLAKQYKTSILQQQFKNNLITNKNTNSSTSANVCEI